MTTQQGLGFRYLYVQINRKKNTISPKCRTSTAPDNDRLCCANCSHFHFMLSNTSSFVNVLYIFKIKQTSWKKKKNQTSTNFNLTMSQKLLHWTQSVISSLEPDEDNSWCEVQYYPWAKIRMLMKWPTCVLIYRTCAHHNKDSVTLNSTLLQSFCIIHITTTWKLNWN